MAVHRLDNASWGFESNCFVCERSNEGGLRIPFFYDDEAGRVFADYTLDATFSGTPAYVHGGITMAVLDEAMAWAAIAVANAFALTEQNTTRFRRGVKVGRSYRVEAWVVSHSDSKVEAEATVTDERGKVCAEAGALFRPMSQEHAKSAIGSELSGDDAGYLRG
ncbi:MAG: PaaI family thioesterase [Actinobacteria bacterium]|nr:PaaI family thioesterase [Actinomycetota bacterium]